MLLAKEKAKENLSILLTKFEKEASSGRIREYNEEAAKTAFIQPLLKDVLGWDVNDRDEVSPEENISRGRVDYGLKVENKIKIYVEAKPPRADLNKHIEQAVRYGYNRKGVPFVLLTDFEGLMLFDVTVKPDSRNLKKGLKLDLSWNRYLETFDKLWLLSKESVIRGELDNLLLIKPKDRIPVDKAILDDLKLWRELLAKDLFKNNPSLFHSGDSEKDAAYLKEITQRLLDRIIFMRFCEDRGLTYERSLKDVFEERTETVGTNTMVFLGAMFSHYNNTFDSDLFRPQDWETGLAIDFKTAKEIILETYNPYQFDVIPLEVLGNIYEQYLGYTVRLTDHQVKYELKPEVRKAGGVYYTPEYIVDYIAKNTVGKMLKDLPAPRAKKLRILDPACGSGSFLIRAYEELLSYYLNEKKSKLKGESKQGKLELGHESEAVRLTIFEKSRILQEHIFGVDIDEQAVEVTKLSLMLKMLEGEYGIIPGRAILPMLDKNIKCGNSLISGTPLELKKYFGDDWYKAKPFNWEDEFPKIIKDEGGFSVVIGNPPYGYLIPENQKDYFADRYYHQDYQKDWYLLFLERYHLLLKESGLLGVIVSNTWLQSLKYRSIRLYLTSSYHWQRILQIKEKAFPATVDTHILIFKKNEKGLSQRGTMAIDQRDKEMITPFHRLSFKFIPRNGDPINIVASESAYYLVNKIRKWSSPLSRVCSVFNGVKPFEKGKGIPPQSDNIIKNKPYVKEGPRPDSSWSPLLRGSLIQRYRTLWHQDYWIKYGPWLAAPRDPRIFEAPEKIMVRQTGDSIIATIVRDNSIARNNLHILLSKTAKYRLPYILGIMNSKLIDFFYTFMNPEKGEALAEVKKEHVENLPVRTVDFDKSVGKKLHDDLVALAEIMLNLNKQLQSAKGAEKEQVQKQIEKTDREIDDLVYRLYGITDEEKRIIEEGE